MKAICFAIPVHENKDVVKDMLDNIRFFCPNSSIVLYHSGNDPHLCDGLGYLVCPRSRNLTSIQNTFVLYYLDTMKWLHEIDFQYDYLVFIDSDTLFGRRGFEEFIFSEMKDADFMATYFRIPEKGWFPGTTMEMEWEKWKNIFDSNSFLACFNNGQVFSRMFVQKILEFPKLAEIEKNIRETRTYALEEILFATLARTLGMRSKGYPAEVQRSVRWRPYFTKNEVANLLKDNIFCYHFHPVRRIFNDEAREFIRSLISY